MSKRVMDLQMADPVLTSVSRGYTNNTLIAEQLLPVVEVDTESGKVPEFGKEAFKILSTERGLSAQSNRAPGLSKRLIPYEAMEYDIEVAIDDRERKSDATGTIEADTTEYTMDIIKLGYEARVAAAMQSSANYGNTTSLASGDKFTNSSSDIVGIIKTLKGNVNSKIGKDPNVLVLAYNSFQALTVHPALLDKIKYSKTAVIDIPTLQELLGFEKILVGEAIVYSDSTQQFTRLWSNTAAALWQNLSNEPNLRKPAYGWTLRLRSQPFTAKYREEQTSSDIVRTKLVQCEKIVGIDAGALLTGTCS